MGRTEGFQCGVWDTVEIPGTPLSSRLRDGKDRGISLLCVGIPEVSSLCSVTKDRGILVGQTVGIPRTPYASLGLEDRKAQQRNLLVNLDITRVCWTI